MLIVRSTIDPTEILRMIREQYPDILPGANCLFEYRGINDIYRYTNAKSSLFFKIYGRTDLTRDEIEAEVEILNHLKQSGLSVTYPIASKDDNYLLPIEVPEGTRYGVLYSEAEGKPWTSDLLDETETSEVGQLFSNMHTMLDTIPTSPIRWTLDERLFLDQSLEILEKHSRFNPQIDLQFLQAVVKELKSQIQAKARGWNWGLCHGDAFNGNIHRNKTGSLTIFDFDFCGYGWRAYDVAIFLGIFSAGTSSEVVEKRKKTLEFFLRGYNHAGGFSDTEIDSIYKIFAPFRRIFNMGYLYESLSYVWGNRLRNDQISQDTKRLREWVDTYW